MEFSILKKGQGTIARLIGGALALIFAYYSGCELYIFLTKFWNVSDNWGVASGCLLFLVLLWLFVYLILVKSSTVDFLIETEMEMRKVNWPTRKEVQGATGVVVSTVVILSGYVFLNDLVIGYLLDVLRIF